jgi:hypothetical protein
MIEHLKGFLEHRGIRALDRALTDPVFMRQLVDRLPLDGLALLQAKWSTAAMINREMIHAEPLADRLAVLDRGLRSVTRPGLWLEYGVFRGETLRHIASQAPAGTLVHGFDVFAGLPEDWRHGFPAGTFATPQADLAALPANTRLVPGLFADSLPPFLTQHAEPVAFLHMDCDLYSSCVDVLSLLAERFVAGTVIVFDELMGYPGWEQGEYLAFQEFIARQRRGYRFLAYNRSGEQAALQFTD